MEEQGPRERKENKQNTETETETWKLRRTREIPFVSNIESPRVSKQATGSYNLPASSFQVSAAL